MSLANETPFAVQAAPHVDRDGSDILVVIIKGTFLLDRTGNARAVEDPSPIRLNDELVDPASPRSSLRFPSDLGSAKLGTDVVVVGDAISASPVKVLDVAVKIKQRTLPLRIHGARVFFQGAFGASISPGQPFQRMPIVYERAYGGASPDLSVVEARNPSGVGVARRASDLFDKPAPQIEHPLRPHTSSSDRHPPMGYGAIMTHWSPRREHMGTLDEQWRATRMPLLPSDYDVRFGNFAHPSLQFEEHLTAGDVVGVHGMSLDALVFAIPFFPVLAGARYDTGERAALRPPIDTLLIQPEARRIEVVARAVFPLGRGRRTLREVVVRRDD